MNQRQKVLAGVFVGVIGLVGFAGYQLAVKARDITPSSIQSPSQQDTEVDVSSSRDLLEYAYSAQGELALTDIEQQIKAYIADSEIPLLDQSMLEAFVSYKKALMSLDAVTNSRSLAWQEMEQLHFTILDLQQQFFTPEQRETLFGEENRLRHMAIEKKRIQVETMDAQDAQSQWSVLLAQQPEYIQSSERNVQLMSALANNQQLSEQERYLNHVALVGEEGAQRLEAFENEKENFEVILADYLAQRRLILVDLGLSEEAKQQQIEQLRQKQFDPKQWKRVAALERINDSSS